jgi:hypothetical protein
MKIGLRRRILDGITPRRVAMAAWLALMVALGNRLAVGATRQARGDRLYFCQYSSACKNANIVDLHCCRDIQDDGAENRTTLFTCRPICGK